MGALVVGLDAERAFNTWPTMADSWVPDHLTQLDPVWRNAVDNPATVQFLHRWLAVVVAASALAIAHRLWRAGTTPLATALASVTAVQITLGVMTLLHAVPLPLGVAHQAGAVLLLAVAIVAGHRSNGGMQRSHRMIPRRVPALRGSPDVSAGG